MKPKCEKIAVTLLFENFLFFLVLPQGSLGITFVCFWPLLRFLSLFFCCKGLGLLQDGIEVIKF